MILSKWSWLSIGGGVTNVSLSVCAKFGYPIKPDYLVMIQVVLVTVIVVLAIEMAERTARHHE